MTKVKNVHVYLAEYGLLGLEGGVWEYEPSGWDSIGHYCFARGEGGDGQQWIFPVESVLAITWVRVDAGDAA